MSLRVCSFKGCPTLCDTGRCDKHPRPKRKYRKHQLTNAQRGYGTSHRKWRASVLKRDPICVDCNSVEATEAHHIDGNTFNRTLGNGIGLCRRCHNRRTHGKHGDIPPTYTRKAKGVPSDSSGDIYIA